MEKEVTKMTEVLALCLLVLSALLTVSHCTEHDGDVIVKDGQRVVVVVEYDGNGKTNTRVFIISRLGKGREEEEKRYEKGGELVYGNAKKGKETASSSPVEEKRDHKMGTVLGRVNDLTPSETVARAAGDVEEKLSHEGQYAEETVTGKAKEEVHNKSAMKKANKVQNVWEKKKMAARSIVTAVATALKLRKIGSVIGLLGIAAAYGMCVWVTFLSSYILASVLGRQQLAVVQSKVYPVYFKAVSVGILLGLLGHIISRHRKVFTDAVDMWQTVNLFSSILMVEANASFVEPRATKAMFERIKAEKEEGRGLDTSESRSTKASARTSGKKKVTENMSQDAPRLKKLSERLNRLNAYSSRLNLLTLMSLTCHLLYLGQRLDLTC